MVRFDPRDLSRVYLETPTDYIAAELANGPAMAFSLWEWREVRASALAASRSRDPDRIAEELAANRLLIREKVSGRHRGAGRRLARQVQWHIDSDVLPPNGHLLKSRALAQAPRCRVEGEETW